MSIRESFQAGLGFDLDGFQSRALDALDRGGSVVVAAPTGAGKTVVAEYAVARALDSGHKAFYTTPLKALSNQKYKDLCATHGAQSVGLLTGDNSINSGAPVVVMTTEVLRNMIYAHSASLLDLRFVVLDEVHYLQNAYRGPVWEEVIVHCPEEVKLVCLSATVSNAEELADWIRTVRGETTAVIEDSRPVELNDLYLLGDRRSERLLLMPTLVEGRPNREAAALDAGGFAYHFRGGRRRERLYTPRRADVVDLLEGQGMLPAIYFIFSRAGCEEAVARCAAQGKRLTTIEEGQLVRKIAERFTDGLSDDDLALLGYGAWVACLEAGYAAHHAGLVPPFKEAVEACFAEGLVKVVFATETLALGINMPARSVVIEKLTKFTGERHEFLTPGEYTQLTGRAGRRGIDDVGFAVVLWSRFVSFDQVASLVGARSYTLTSSFRPTYNMAVNLVRRYEPATAHHLLNLSFAQYRTDSELVRLETRLDRVKERMADAERGAMCERGDLREYRRALQASEEPARAAPTDGREIRQALERLRPGDVVAVSPGAAADRHDGKAAVISTSRRRGGEVRVRAVTARRKVLTLAARDLALPPRRLTHIELPTPYAPHNNAFLKRVASALTATNVDDHPSADAHRNHRVRHGEVVSSQAAALADHPVSSCPDLAKHLAALERAEKSASEVERLKRIIIGRSESLARQFDRVLTLLGKKGYVDGWSLTERGERLCGLYHECDLLIVECMEAGLFDGLPPQELAGLVSVFTFEARGQGAMPAKLSSGRLRQRWSKVQKVAKSLNAAESELSLTASRPLDAGFADLAVEWARGRDLTVVLEEEEVSGGDFVRNVKQLIDLLRQISEQADGATATAAGRAADMVFRGVVAASSAVSA